MSKVYGIIIDKNMKCILVGVGGTSGNHAKPRVGYHLPGGSIGKTAKNAVVAQANQLATLVKELGEEFGSKIAEAIKSSKHSAMYKEKIMDGLKIYLIAIIVDTDTDGLSSFAGNVTDGSGTVHDSPFAKVEMVTLKDAMAEFRKHESTSWFFQAMLAMGADKVEAAGASSEEGKSGE